MVELVGALLIVAVLYASSWWLHPYRACKRCKGSGKHFGALHQSKWRNCDQCEGKGKSARLGTKLMVSVGLHKPIS